MIDFKFVFCLTLFVSGIKREIKGMSDGLHRSQLAVCYSDLVKSNGMDFLQEQGAEVTCRSTTYDVLDVSRRLTTDMIVILSPSINGEVNNEHCLDASLLLLAEIYILIFDTALPELSRCFSDNDDTAMLRAVCAYNTS